MNKLKFWYNNSRPYSIPITLLCWLVIFVYGIKSGGNIIYGIIAYIGIFFVHLATNLSDDYFDYKRLVNNPEFLNSTKEIKCKYLKSGQATTDELKNVILIMLTIAGICAWILFFTAGIYVAIFALIGLFIALSYSFMSSKGLGDLSVITAYGPLMYCGVFYVMCGGFNIEVLILSIACAIMVDTILYAHMLMDFDEDEISHKITICTLLGKNNALKLLLGLYGTVYAILVFLVFYTKNVFYILPVITIILALDLYKLLKKYNEDKTNLPEIKFWYKPLDNWNEKSKTQNAPFFLRFMYTRNIVTWFMLLISLGIILK